MFFSFWSFCSILAFKDFLVLRCPKVKIFNKGLDQKSIVKKNVDFSIIISSRHLFSIFWSIRPILGFMHLLVQRCTKVEIINKGLDQKSTLKKNVDFFITITSEISFSIFLSIRPILGFKHFLVQRCTKVMIFKKGLNQKSIVEKKCRFLH